MGLDKKLFDTSPSLSLSLFQSAIYGPCVIFFPVILARPSFALEMIGLPLEGIDENVSRHMAQAQPDMN